MHKYESNASMLSRVIFYLKSVTFLFLFSIYPLFGQCKNMAIFYGTIALSNNLTYLNQSN